MMSLRYGSSHRIDELGVGEHVRPDARFQAVLRYEVNFPPKKLLQVQHQPGMLHQAHFRIRQKLDQEVDIAVRPHFATGGRSKKGEFPNLVSPAEVSQFGLLNLY